jgi:gamma-glutamyl:cysteine ligase YbdK (ATP-grasp superfamily)
MNITKTGIELELWVIDRSGRLCDGTAIIEAHERIEGEFIDPLLEVRTEPHTDHDELQSDLQRTLGAAIRAANAEDKRLVPMGTPLTPSNASANCIRGHLFETIYGDGVKSAKNCAGTHIHFDQTEVTRQINLLTALDPALALVSSSPYYDGQCGADSCRARAYRKECGSQFREYCDLWSYTESEEDWQARVEAAYENFVELAREQGVPEEIVEKFFTPEDTVLNPVRLRPNLGTVEWRAPDAALPSEIVQLATDVGQLVTQAESKPLSYGSPHVREDGIRLPDFSQLKGLSRRAIASGLEARDVRSYLQNMSFDVTEYSPLSLQIDTREPLTESRASRLRLEQARRLHNDVATLTESPVLPTAPAL